MARMSKSTFLASNLRLGFLSSTVEQFIQILVQVADSSYDIIGNQIQTMLMR